MPKSKTSSDILFTLFIELATRLRGLVFIPVISGTLGVAAFGAYSQIIAISSFLELVFGLGLYSALVRFGQNKKYSLADLYLSHTIVAVFSGVLITVVVVRFSPVLSSLTLGSSRYSAAFQIGSLLIVTRILFRMARNYFRIDSRIKIFSTINGIKAYGLVGTVAYIVLFRDGGVFEVMLGMVVVELVFVLFTNVLIVREIGLTVPTFPDLLEHLQYGLPLSVSSLANTAASRVDRVLIGFFLGASAVGVYSIAYQIATSISIYITPIRQTFFPEFSRFIENGEPDRCIPYLNAGVRYYLILSVPTVGGIYLIGQPVVSKLIGSSQPLPSGFLIALIAAGILLSGLDTIYGVILTASKRTRRLSEIRIVGAVSNLLLNLVLIPQFGIVGAGLATLLTYLFTSIVVFMSISTVRVSFTFITLLRTLVGTALMIAGVRILEIESMWYIVVVGSMIYFVVGTLTREIKISEIKSVLS